MDTNWRPDVARIDGPLYRALADQIVAAVSAGDIPPGARLPPVRDLAWDIKVSPGAVARAYRIATQRGALEATVGRGTFARPPGGEGFALDALLAPAPSEQIDLRGNRAPDIGQEGAIADALRRILDRGSLSLTDYPRLGQDLPAREAMTRWLQAGGVPAEAGRVIPTAGAHEAVMAALCALSRGGEGLAYVEPFVHPGVKDCADAARVRLEPVAADEHGMDPDALDAACARRRPDAVLLTADFHNPTNACMPPERRAAIAAVARARDLAIVEDDVYGWLAPKRGDSFAALAPERCWYVTSLSKCVAAGLRIGMMLTPPGQTTRSLRAHQAIAHHTPALLTHLAAELIDSGEAARVRDRIAAEIAARAADAAAAE
jgi:DNA-binding transcriptional MocR family regulator